MLLFCTNIDTVVLYQYLCGGSHAVRLFVVCVFITAVPITKLIRRIGNVEEATIYFERFLYQYLSL